VVITFTLICESCGKQFVSKEEHSEYCGLCKVQEAKDAAQDRLENIKRKLGADGAVQSSEAQHG
jgi:Zn finger protein HypA/HybF involved in hydrogenase expression